MRTGSQSIPKALKASWSPISTSLRSHKHALNRSQANQKLFKWQLARGGTDAQESRSPRKKSRCGAPLFAGLQKTPCRPSYAASGRLSPCHPTAQHNRLLCLDTVKGLLGCWKCSGACVTLLLSNCKWDTAAAAVAHQSRTIAAAADCVHCCWCCSCGTKVFQMLPVTVSTL